MIDQAAIDAIRTRKLARPPISLGRLRQCLHYNPDTGIFTRVEDVKNQRARAGMVAGGDTGIGYIAIMVDGRRYKAHRLAWFYVYGKWPEKSLDHKNGVRSDNRISNLREATQSEQTRNSKRRSDNLAGYKGVSFHKASGKWAAQISYDGKAHWLGSFPTKELARAMYRAKAREVFGEFYTGGE